MNTLLMAAALMFPTVHGQTAYERNVTLPDELNGKANVVIVMFQKDQQALADTWLPVVQDLANENADLRFSRGKQIAPESRRYVDDDLRLSVTQLAVRFTMTCGLGHGPEISRAGQIIEKLPTLERLILIEDREAKLLHIEGDRVAGNEKNQQRPQYGVAQTHAITQELDTFTPCERPDSRDPLGPEYDRLA